MSVKQVYMDYAASTPVCHEALEAMQPFWADHYGNPSSVHTPGRQAGQALASARKAFADLINAQPDEIVFTGCGSESDNLAIRGAMWAARAAGRGNHLITCPVEHKAVLETAYQLRDVFGFEVTVVPVDQYGQVNLDEIEAAIQADTVLISIMAANNEIGTLQPIQGIGELARARGILFHTDAIQAAGVLPWDMQAMTIDLLSLSAHKFYGPKGCGVLYVNRNVELISSLTGGDHENGRRSGTVNVPLVVGAAEAFRLAVTEGRQASSRLSGLRDRLISGVRAAFPGDCILTGHPSERLPNNASFAFRNLSGNDILMHLDMAGIAASSGSACLSGDPKPSRVLQAVGLTSDWTKGGLRLTVGRQTTMEDVEYVLEVLPNIVGRLRKLAGKYG